MKAIKYISAALLIASFALASNAQVVKKRQDNAKGKSQSEQVSGRMQSKFDSKKSSDADLQWQRTIYRSLELSQVENMPLYYPEEPGEDGMNLFFIIMKNLADNKLAAYEYLDGREAFTDEYRINVGDMMDRFHILYIKAKGSSEKNPKFAVENADIPANEVLSYYIVETYEFNRTHNKVTRKVEAICPVLHRSDDFGGEAIKYPMFWVKMSDLRPHIAQQFVFTSNDNNLLTTSLDDYFANNSYKGDIYKFKNMRNLSMMQMYPDEAKRKHAQDSIEKRLASFDANLWVPTREELREMAAKRDSVNAGNNANPEKTKSSNTRSKSKRSESTSKSNKKKETKVKTTKTKTTNSSATRSVRRTK